MPRGNTVRALCTASVLVVLMSGCGSFIPIQNVVSEGPGGVMVGLAGGTVGYPNEVGHTATVLQLSRDDVQLLETVRVDSSSHAICFGLVSFGDSGYTQLLEAARERGGDGVMNVAVDTKVLNVLLMYRSVTTRLSGIAFKYKLSTSAGRTQDRGSRPATGRS